MRCFEISSPMRPTPTKPIVSMVVPPVTPCCHCPSSCDVKRALGEIQGDGHPAFHQHPFAHLDIAEAVYEKRILLREGAGFVGGLRVVDAQAVAHRLTVRA